MTTDSIATAYHAVVSKGRVPDSTTVAVVGPGGLGLNGVAIAALRGAKVFERRHQHGQVRAGEGTGCRGLCHRPDAFQWQSFDVVLDLTGAQPTVEAAVATVRAGGYLVLVGLAAREVRITTTSLVKQNVSLRGLTSTRVQKLREWLNMLAWGSLKPYSQEIPFEDIPKALELLGQGKVSGRLYTVP